MESVRGAVSDALAVNNSAGFAQQAFSSLVLLGTYAYQAVLGRFNTSRTRAHQTSLSQSVSSFIESETPIALSSLLCNIGSTGCFVAGAASGAVIASPSKEDPDYFYTWTRDSALVFKSIVDIFTSDYNDTLQDEIQDYIASQAFLQGVSNPSGSLRDGSGLGEPKFNSDLSEFIGSWGRPQRDGPALRAVALASYAKWLIVNDYASTARRIIWPVIHNDISYVAEYWNQTGFDLWEEVSGSSFFTVANQHRALVEGCALAETLNIPCPVPESVAPQILCFLQTFWSTSDGYIVANINENSGRSGKDANTILASISTFDPAAGCDSLTFQPCSDKALANHKIVTDAFRAIYPINSGILQGHAVAVGRYPEDIYFGGHPWYLNTLAAAEQLYDALYVWKAQGYITVTPTSLFFFHDLVPDIVTGTYQTNTPVYTVLHDVVSKYADGYMNVVATYAQTNGSMAEQYSRSDGTPLSARDLTWSYAAFLTAAARRDGSVPPSWISPPIESVPGSCSGTSVLGSYTSATETSFPPSQTPKKGATTSPTTTKKPDSTTSTCASATMVAVTFNEFVTTLYGQTIKIVGDIDALGNWNPDQGIVLSASEYTPDNPLWSVTVNLQPGQVIEYKYINVAADSTITWEGDPNHTFTAPASCATAITKSDSWQL